MSRTDEWYTETETVKKCYQLLNPKPGSVILCPFDTEKSEFVKIGQSMGHTIIFGINDFIEGDLYRCDYICTNPPFSLKDKVIEKCFEYGVETMLVMPLDVMGGIKRRKLYQRYGFPRIWMPIRRIAYFDSNWVRRPASNFHSILLHLNHGRESEIMWEKDAACLS